MGRGVDVERCRAIQKGESALKATKGEGRGGDEETTK